MLDGSNGNLLVLFSLVVSILASYTTLVVADRITTSSGRPARWRLSGGACTLGIGVWSVHFIGMSVIGMLAFDLPIGTGYNLLITLLSLLFAVAAYTFALWTVLQVKELAEANQELTYLALYDNLTKLPNRVLLKDRLNQAIERARREKCLFALMFIDLDGFKAINDVYGHQLGDMLLVIASRRIVENIRGCDTVARVGGDEFVVLALVDEQTDAGVLAYKLVAAIGEPYLVNGHELHVSTSIGIAIYPRNGENQDELLANADAAMYHVKGSGRGDYCFFEKSMISKVHDQVQLLQDLRMALKRNELVLYYQPKFTAPHGPITGLEALLRWMHPAHGMLRPASFIPLAEKTGLIVPIGEWVLNEACQQMAAWRDEGCEDWTIAVNLSEVQFAHSGLVDVVRGNLDRHRLEPHRLVLEITESTVMRDVSRSKSILQKLYDIGVHVSIDDFGTGYSCLPYLNRLPVMELKIDCSLVYDLTCDTEDEAIISAIVALGQKLALRVVAEGVETSAQQEFLTHLGCDALQGYLLAYPMQADEVIALSNIGKTSDDRPVAPDEIELF